MSIETPDAPATLPEYVTPDGRFSVHYDASEGGIPKFALWLEFPSPRVLCRLTHFHRAIESARKLSAEVPQPAWVSKVVK